MYDGPYDQRISSVSKTTVSTFGCRYFSLKDNNLCTRLIHISKVSFSTIIYPSLGKEECPTQVKVSVNGILIFVREFGIYD